MYTHRPIGWKTGAATALAVALAATPAPAFYWVGWPGVNVQQPPQIISNQIKVIHRDPTVVPPGPNGPPGTEEPPGGVPEPATLLMAGIGLAGVAGVRWVRKRK